MKKTSRKRGAQTGFAGRTGSAPSLTVKAWAIVNKETGRLMLREVTPYPMPLRTEMPCIWMKRSEADYFKECDERLVRINITVA